ncbi:MAG: DUF4388 domain-containing protein [Candidatus Eisenbacteria bacterium]
MGLRGNLAEFGAVEVFQLLASQGKTGVLRLYRTAKKAAFVFSGGEIVSTWDRSASLTDPLKTHILRKKVLPEHQAMRALRLEARADIPFAEILLREGMIDLPETARLVREQITGEVLEVLEWDQGRFEFTPEHRTKTYGPGCAVKVESVLLEAVRRFDEREPGRPKSPGDGGGPAGQKTAAGRGLREFALHGAILAMLPVAALLLSYVAVPVTPADDREPVFGIRVAQFNREREVRNLRLVLEMYRTLHDRYPKTLADLTNAGLLSGRQVSALRVHEIRYRSLRNGTRYFLHSGSYGPLVRALPASFEPRPLGLPGEGGSYGARTLPTEPPRER